MPRLLHHDALRRLCAKALASGATRTSVTTLEWDLAGQCQSPVSAELCARPEANDASSGIWDPASRAKYYHWSPGRPQTMILRLTTKCRKCDRCRSARGALWRARAITEFRNAPRNWMGTLTLCPERRMQVVAGARRDFKLATGLDLDLEPLDVQLGAYHKICNREITLSLKRLRVKNPSFRYLCVLEQHKDGSPHYHVLLHETAVDAPIRKDQHLRAFWAWGFSKWKLCNNSPAAASYVAKYLAKSSAARVRASIRYGDPPDIILPSLLNMERLGWIADPLKGKQTIKCSVQKPDPKEKSLSLDCSARQGG